MSQLGKKHSIITEQNPMSPISEVYRTLRTNIQFSSIDSPVKSIMVTSAGAGEGKTTTLTNLAVAYAQANMNVIIVDADLRKPSIHEYFSLSNRLGVTNVLAHQVGKETVITKSGIPYLDVIPAGTIPPNPSELLASQHMSKLIEELSQTYDAVFIDTPPVLLVTDAQVMATKCDGVLLVVHYGKVKREDLRKAKANLQLVNANVLGTVLNKYAQKGMNRYHYYAGEN
ncbi:CpsD/CapB family tyrosine-protein kinase [Paenibacillus sp. UMB4589-SE434]|uniref:CpsD/CapB family tyrosine-protein kinase n=1 Tax=Paenibacillus sp. UMB4589-SE434 TaxID=3046314 RepID=UPI00254DDA86|nr:CpsD/CapB family tyrosine-protein kinase [Paenibacillus sp. UMB4589-SE434]MDK8182550.1 CpsD/CapB family tyrosine-protein kinase [Paenibacillus sp. UMB4589-SE434]